MSQIAGVNKLINGLDCVMICRSKNSVKIYLRILKPRADACGLNRAFALPCEKYQFTGVVLIPLGPDEKAAITQYFQNWIGSKIPTCPAERRIAIHVFCLKVRPGI